jgi:hypothetical protein
MIERTVEYSPPEVVALLCQFSPMWCCQPYSVLNECNRMLKYNIFLNTSLLVLLHWRNESLVLLWLVPRAVTLRVLCLTHFPISYKLEHWRHCACTRKISGWCLTSLPSVELSPIFSSSSRVLRSIAALISSPRLVPVVDSFVSSLIRRYVIDVKPKAYTTH